MKMLRIIMILLGALLLTNCSGDFEQETGIVSSHSGQVSFLFGLQQDDASVVQTRGSKPEQITRMWYAIANERGEIIKPLYQKLEENFSKLTIEGLSMGDYTVVFLATTVVETDVIVTKLPPMRNLGLCGNVLCVSSEFLVHEEHHTATTSGDSLVAIE